MIQPQTVTQNDYGYQIPFTLEDGNGNAVDLSGASLSLSVQSAQDPTGTNLSLGGSMAIDSAVAGTCHYTVANGDFPSSGTFLTQVIATWTGSERLSWEGPHLIVKSALPQAMN